jgi:hypothetical protein
MWRDLTCYSLASKAHLTHFYLLWRGAACLHSLSHLEHHSLCCVLRSLSLSGEMRNKTNLCLRERFPAQLLIALVVSIAVPPSFILPCTVVFIESVSKNAPNEKNLEGDQGSPKSKQRQQCCHVCHMAHRYPLNIVTNVRHCLPHTRASLYLFAHCFVILRYNLQYI